MARFISIISEGNGTGKTTVALNLGLALHKMKQNVLVFDADFSKPNMIEHLNIQHLPITLEDVFNGDNHVFDTIYRHASGLKIIPSMIMPDYDKLQYHMQDLLADYDFVILDTPKDNYALTEVLKNSAEAIIVHSPEHSSKIVADASELLKQNKVMPLGIVLNRSHQDSVNSIFQIPVIVKIPDHKSIRLSWKMKQPVLHTYPSSFPSRQFMSLAKRLVV
jgi:flagellar biosynthesis protein FlhG